MSWSFEPPPPGKPWYSSPYHLLPTELSDVGNSSLNITTGKSNNILRFFQYPSTCVPKYLKTDDIYILAIVVHILKAVQDGVVLPSRLKMPCPGNSSSATVAA